MLQHDFQTRPLSSLPSVSQSFFLNVSHFQGCQVKLEMAFQFVLSFMIWGSLLVVLVEVRIISFYDCFFCTHLMWNTP